MSQDMSGPDDRKNLSVPVEDEEQGAGLFTAAAVSVADAAQAAALPASVISGMTKGIPTDPDTIAPGQTQWHLIGAWGLHAEKVWVDYTGAGRMVGVMDDGFQYTHHELSGNYRTDLDRDAFGNDADAAPVTTSERHGTSVMGTIIADDNGAGTVGVAFDAQGYGIRIDLYGQGGTLAQIISGFQYAHDTGLDVMNNSWGFSTPFSDVTNIDFVGADFIDLTNVMRDITEDGRAGLGSNIVFAAGNARADGDNVNHHNIINSPYAIAVAAINADGTITSFSTPGAALLVSAGGTSVYTTDRTGSAGYSAGDYFNFSGTSAAAPVVSGMIAVVLEANPNLGWRDVQEILAYSAQHNDPGNAGWQYNGAGNWNGGGLHFSHDFGYGAADLFTAVRLAESWTGQQTSANMITSTPVVSSPALAIPASGTVTNTINITQDIDIERVIVDLNISHAKAGDLIVKLIGPDGTESVLLNRPVNGNYTSNYGFSGVNFETTSNAHRGESSQGTWTLSITDAVSGNAGTLNSWSLGFMGNAQSTADTYIYTNDYGDFTGAAYTARSTLADTDGGTDTINLSAVEGTTVLNMNAAAQSTVAGKTLTIASGTVIENAWLGDGNDTVTGNAAANVIYGGRGSDALDGGSGTDTVGYIEKITALAFEFVDATTVAISNLAGAAWTDVVKNFEIFKFSDVTYTRMELEIFAADGTAPSIISGTPGDDTLNGTAAADIIYGRAGNDTINGNNGNDTLFGEAGNDIINGGGGNDTINGGTGADTMAGGTGNDTYVVDNAGDVVTEAPAGGNDTVQASASFTLSDNVENLILTGSAAINGTGNAGDNFLTGNTGKNVLTGGAGADVLDGKANADTMAGGAGGDTYYVDNAGDIVTENVAEGNDTVFSGISYALSANVENLILTGTGNINGTGGALKNELTGNSGNNILDGGVGDDTMTGGAGNDTYIVDNVGDIVVEAAGGGTDIVKASASYTLSANVENLTLTGADNVEGTGNTLANILIGNGGDNVLDGRAGADSMTGGAGNDTYVVDDVADLVTEGAGAGTDTVQSHLTYILGVNVENLTLMGTGNLNATGNTLANVLTGNAGNNTLDGKTGADTMAGGAGNDTYVVDNAGDVVNEISSGGVDIVMSGVSHTLSASVENLTLTGTAASGTGNALDNIIIGNGAANTLSGGAGNDRLDGMSGADTMTGGTGDDTYVVDNAADVVTEAAGEGTDTVETKLSYTLGANVENLVMTGTALSGTGNALANVITANASANTIDGKAGADTMIGGAGNDTYIVDNTGDVVVEAAGAGTDIVKASASYTLSANVETLTLTGAGNINGTGNSAANTITGNSGDNVLDGGAGADKMTGGAGNDTYVVDDAGDVVTEAASAGTDTVQAHINYTLGLNVENLTLMAAGNLNATGNTLANVLTGNAGNNTLDGKAGADTMIGGAGNDTYIVDNAGDVVTEAAGAGTDTVMSSVSYALSVHVENLTLTGSAAISATGNTMNNILTGNLGANTLDGGTGADTMTGGAGNDTYIVDNAGDIVVEAASGGVDTVRSGISYTLGSEVEVLVLTGAGNINGTGNAVSNTITGNDGNNVIDGGAGGDKMIGGLGNDTYIVDSTADSASEAVGGGTDQVLSSVTHTLGANVESLTLTGTAAINGTGNAGDNVILGNSGKNTLNGGAGNDTLRGGNGIDTLLGGDGDDLLYGQEGADVLTGGLGADDFVFEAATALGAIDKINDFNTADGDALDISDVLSGYDALSDLLTDFVQITTSGANSILKVDIDGAGTVHGFVQIALISGVTGLTDEAALVSAGNLIA